MNRPSQNDCCAHVSFTHQSRQKDLRVKGADLYVARLARNVNHNESHRRGRREGRASRRYNATEDAVPTSDTGDGLSSSPKSMMSGSGSLHEELIDPLPRTRGPSPPSSAPRSQLAEAVESRPCYRCLAYMHAAGIRRVFWTNQQGQWEGGKLRDLVEALSHAARPGADVVGGALFVTKHEILRLRRAMGDD